jgi:hypothetical protein
VRTITRDCAVYTNSYKNKPQVTDGYVLVEKSYHQKTCPRFCPWWDHHFWSHFFPSKPWAAAFPACINYSVHHKVIVFTLIFVKHFGSYVFEPKKSRGSIGNIYLYPILMKSVAYYPIQKIHYRKNGMQHKGMLYCNDWSYLDMTHRTIILSFPGCDWPQEKPLQRQQKDLGVWCAIYAIHDREHDVD